MASAFVDLDSVTLQIHASLKAGKGFGQGVLLMKSSSGWASRECSTYHYELRIMHIM